MKTIIIGFDAFDPNVFERLNAAGKLPNLNKFVESGAYARFAVADPPQSEVSWTSIATGLGPGGHGIFDFVHRNPENYGLSVSLLPTKSSAVGIQFVPPHQAKTLFDVAVEDGFPATSLWWPATFPAKLESPVRTIPGLGAPDVHGRLGVGILYTTEPEKWSGDLKTTIEKLESEKDGSFKGMLAGPAAKTLTGTKEIQLPVQLEIIADQAAKLTIEKETIDLELGQWSPIFEIPFKLGFGISVKAVTRALLTQAGSTPAVYLLPLQMHPLHNAWRYATPKGFVKEIWEKCGPFLTLGWPQDTTALEESVITDEQFLHLCELVIEERERVFMYLLDHFEEGVLGCVFDTLDRVQHMFWHSQPDIIDAWYLKLDALLGRIQERIAHNAKLQDANILIVSDHGFNNFDHKVHLNRWLVDQGYLALQNEKAASLKDADWPKTRAYAIGLNSLYLNLDGREGQGAIKAAEKEAMLNKIKTDLLAWKGPDGQSVVQRVSTQQDFPGPLAEYGPDFIIGYAPGYRASAETGLGEWGAQAIQPNQDHWGADHCFDAAAVPGVLFSNQPLGVLEAPSYRDFPALALGKTITPSNAAPPPPSYSDEDQAAVEERLKDLGYL